LNNAFFLLFLHTKKVVDSGGKNSQYFFAKAEGGEGAPLEGRHAVIER
jgi:hypothetical protein